MVFGAQHTSAADDAPRWPGLNAFLVRRPRVPNGIPDGLSRIVRVTIVLSIIRSQEKVLTHLSKANIILLPISTARSKIAWSPDSS